MLGIDVGDNSIRVVNLRRRGGAFVVGDPLETPFSKMQGEDVSVLAKHLAEALRARGWQGQKAVLTLPRRCCFVRRFAAETLGDFGGVVNGSLSKAAVEAVLARARESMLVPAEQLVLDLWDHTGIFTGDDNDAAGGSKDGEVLVAAAEKSAVDFCRELAQAAGVKVQSVELRSLASINGLMFHWHDAAEENIAVVYVEGYQADVALLDANGLRSLQWLTVGRRPDEKTDAVDSSDLIEQLRQVFNTEKLSDHGCVPQRMFIAHRGEPSDVVRPDVAQLERELKIPVSACQSFDGLVSWADQEGQKALVEFVPALGAALDGLGASAAYFDFLHPRGRATKRPRRISWKPLMAIAATLLVAGSVYWLNLVQQRQKQLRELEGQISQTAPEREMILATRAKWELFRSFLPAQEGGSRQEYLGILYEITRLFPHTKEAYVTELYITPKLSVGGGSSSDITIKGQANKDEVATKFFEDLEQSPMFEDVKRGPITRESENALYQVGFSVTCKLERGGGGAGS